MSDKRAFFSVRTVKFDFNIYIYIIGMKDRIREIIDWANLSQQDFANRLGISPASLSSIFTGRTNPTNNHVQAIHRVFPEINVNWLLFGEGGMLSSPVTSEEPGVTAESPTSISEASPVLENGKMMPMFSEDDFAAKSAAPSSLHHTSTPRRENTMNRVAGFQYMDSMKNIDKHVRKIKEIRVFFDDGTYESFVPSSGK